MFWAREFDILQWGFCQLKAYSMSRSRFYRWREHPYQPFLQLQSFFWWWLPEKKKKNSHFYNIGFSTSSSWCQYLNQPAEITGETRLPLWQRKQWALQMESLLLTKPTDYLYARCWIEHMTINSTHIPIAKNHIQKSPMAVNAWKVN